jgi:N-terminal domain of anti-restriction factor ArdC
MHHDYDAIVTEALNAPGKLSERYSAFWNYSLGNQWYAMVQLGRAEPISTFPGWKTLGRHVKKGEKAIELLMPVFKKSKDEVTGEKREGSLSFFMPRRNWFGLHQTEGEEYVAVVPNFDVERALQTLEISKEAFQQVDGNCQG